VILVRRLASVVGRPAKYIDPGHAIDVVHLTAVRKVAVKGLGCVEPALGADSYRTCGVADSNNGGKTGQTPALGRSDTQCLHLALSTCADGDELFAEAASAAVAEWTASATWPVGSRSYRLQSGRPGQSGG